VTPHAWVSSRVGHGVAQCERCTVTLLEAAAIGTLNECPVEAPPPALGWRAVAAVSACAIGGLALGAGLAYLTSVYGFPIIHAWLQA
jgi:hypothetical protein